MHFLHQNLVAIILTTLIIAFSASLPLNEINTENIGDESLEVNDEIEKTNKTQHLYVVKAVVYEIGILTESDENDTSSEETQERVDLTFFDAHTNKSHIDLGNIPLPVQTNVSGQVLTGIAPINIGAFQHPSDLLSTIPLTGTIVNITHSDTAFFKLSRHNITSDIDALQGSYPQNFLHLAKPLEGVDED